MMRWVHSICMTCSKGIQRAHLYDIYARFPGPLLPGEGSAAVARACHHPGRRVDSASDPFGAELGHFWDFRIRIFRIFGIIRILDSTLSDLSDPILFDPFGLLILLRDRLENWTTPTRILSNKSHIFALALIWYDSIDFLLALRPWAAVLVSASIRWQFMNSTVIVSAQLRKSIF